MLARNIPNPSLSLELCYLLILKIELYVLEILDPMSAKLQLLQRDGYLWPYRGPFYPTLCRNWCPEYSSQKQFCLYAYNILIVTKLSDFVKGSYLKAVKKSKWTLGFFGQTLSKTTFNFFYHFPNMVSLTAFCRLSLHQGWPQAQ